MKLKTKQILHSAVIVAGLVFSQAANASLWQFELSGDFSKNWVIDTASVKGNPDNYIYIQVDDSGATMAGTEIRIFSQGGLEIHNFSRYYLTPLVYMDTPWPLYASYLNHIDFFWEGTMALSGYTHGTTPGKYSLTISYIPEFPEPGTYAMLLAGLGLMGAVVRRRQKSV